MTYTAEVYDSEGTLAIQRDGQDILHVTRVDQTTAASEYAETHWHPMTEREHQALIVRIAGLFTEADGKYHNPDGRVYWGEYEEAEKLFGRGMYYVTETPEDPSLNPCWVGVADNPVDALNRFSVASGFAGYGESEMRKEVGIWADDEFGADPAGAFATFTNTTIYSGLIPGAMVEQQQPRTVLAHMNITLLETDERPVNQVLSAIWQALEFVSENGGPDPDHHIDFLNVDITGEEI